MPQTTVKSKLSSGKPDRRVPHDSARNAIDRNRVHAGRIVTGRSAMTRVAGRDIESSGWETRRGKGEGVERVNENLGIGARDERTDCERELRRAAGKRQAERSWRRQSRHTHWPESMRWSDPSRPHPSHNSTRVP